MSNTGLSSEGRPGEQLQKDTKEHIIGRMTLIALSVGMSILFPYYNAAMHLRNGSNIATDANASWLDKFGVWLWSGEWAEASYLLMLLMAATAGYTAIMWIYFKRARQIDPTCTKKTALFPQLLPFSMLVVITNLGLGYFSYMELGGQPQCGTSGIDCFGITPLEIYPHVYIPTGAVLFACWGSYFYNCYQMLRRIVNQDFPPSIWLSGAFRTSAAVLASMMVFALVFQMGAGEPKLNHKHWEWNLPSMNLGMILSFSAGFFPMVTIRQVLRFVGRQISRIELLTHITYNPLTNIDGISSEVQDRLQEAGIDSIQLLACASVAMLKAPLRAALPYEPQIIADWIDQAKLALYFPSDGEIKQLKSIGIRTYSNLICYQAEARKTNPQPDWDAIADGNGTITAKRFKNLIMHGQFPDIRTTPEMHTLCLDAGACACACRSHLNSAPIGEASNSAGAQPNA